MNSTDLIYTTYIKTTPEKLWEAITNPEFTRQYWGANANVSDWKKGSTWTHEDTTNNNNIRVTGKILESMPPKRLVMTWFSPKNEADISTLTFEIDCTGDTVRLDIIHAGFKADSTMIKGVSKGWPVVLSSMKSFLETGKPLDVMRILDGGCGSKEAACLNSA